MSRFIYADHAATTALHPAALEAMLPLMTEGWGNPSSLYTFGQRAGEELEKARGQVAAVLNARPDEIFFTSGGTESDNWALRGVAEARQKKGRHLITSAVEHHAILHTAQYLERQGWEVTCLPVDGYGMVSVDDLRAALRPDTVLVSVMLANNEVGTIQPIRELAAAAHEAGALFHTDAVQAVGHIPVDVAELGVDLLSLSGHKFGGPRGVGALYIRKGTPIAHLIQGGGQEKGRRSGTENVAGIVGMAAALTQTAAEMDREIPRLTALRDALLEGLSAIPSSRITGHPIQRLPGTASVIFECIEGESLLLRLDAMGIASSTGSACSSHSLEPSHVLTAMGLPHEIVHGSLRLSLGAEHTMDDVKYLIESVTAAVAGLRALSPLWETGRTA